MTGRGSLPDGSSNVRYKGWPQTDHIQDRNHGPPVGHQGEDDAFFQGCNDIAQRLQHLSGCEMSSVAEQMNTG